MDVNSVEEGKSAPILPPTASGRKAGARRHAAPSVRTEHHAKYEIRRPQNTPRPSFIPAAPSWKQTFHSPATNHSVSVSHGSPAALGPANPSHRNLPVFVPRRPTFFALRPTTGLGLRLRADNDETLVANKRHRTTRDPSPMCLFGTPGTRRIGWPVLASTPSDAPKLILLASLRGTGFRRALVCVCCVSDPEVPEWKALGCELYRPATTTQERTSACATVSLYQGRWSSDPSNGIEQNRRPSC
ncbi:hypothetical protein CKAH01_13556 [Colletotrichum kahawae]|uniref:Uncharacterized protein n=1 Tax=Colletotrichum kahawae TaxID=34407 RepID=A0AAD9YPV5_COLKA|nr:hypothetical protein CKAH01_13556 [Colletotrichum kahawae]